MKIELRGVRDRRIFGLVDAHEVPLDASVIGGGFFLTIKDADKKKETWKARFFV